MEHDPKSHRITPAEDDNRLDLKAIVSVVDANHAHALVGPTVKPLEDSGDLGVRSGAHCSLQDSSPAAGGEAPGTVRTRARRKIAPP